MEEEQGEQEVVILIREYNEVRDFEMAMKLEKSCKNIGSCSSSNEGISIFSCMSGNDPLCRIRLYPLHVMLIAELVNNGEIVGMISGCIKHVETGVEGRIQVKLGSILGLRISPTHRRKGVGLKLLKSMEEWMKQKGANYTFLATEENNVASTNLFTLKCNYRKLTSLTIFVQPINIITTPSVNNNLQLQGTEIKKLATEQAISLYNTHLRNKNMYYYPSDINVILSEKLSLGTWLCYFKDENVEIKSSSITGGSWAIFSIWNTCDAYYKQLGDQVQSWSNKKCDHNVENPKPFGFLFIYGLIGEGKRVGELVKCLWRFALGMAENVKGCKAIMTELGFLDPLIEYVPKQALTSRIDDVWYVKKVKNSGNGESDEWPGHLAEMGTVRNVFVDPRDF